MTWRNEWLSSREAARRLGVSAATLYAYVSRGLLRSEAVDGRRERRYRADDIVAAEAPPRRRPQGRVDRQPRARLRHAGARIGADPDRGRPSLLSRHRCRPAGAHRLAGGGRPPAVGLRRQAVRRRQPAADDHRAAPRLAGRGHARRRSIAASSLLPAAAALDHPSWVEDRAAMLETGVRVLRLLTAAVTARPPSPLPVHEQLAAAWHVPADRAPLLRAALVLSADHEFNASAFAARVVASTGANLYGATMAGLAALNGPRHGGADAPGRRAVRRPQEAPPTSTPSSARRVRDRIYIPGLRPPALSRRRRPRRHAVRPAARDHAATRPSSPSPSGWRRRPSA